MSAWVRWKDKRERFQTAAYQQAPAPPMTPALFAACEKAVHVITTDGETLRAGRACLFIAAELGWRSLARVLSWPPLLWFVEWGYGIVAAHRDLFARFFFTTDHSRQAPELPPSAPGQPDETGTLL